MAPVNAGTLYNHPLVRVATEHARLGSIKSTDLPEPGTKGDLITITNTYYAGQWLYPTLTDGIYYLFTTAMLGSHFWRLM